MGDGDAMGTTYLLGGVASEPRASTPPCRTGPLGRRHPFQASSGDLSQVGWYGEQIHWLKTLPGVLSRAGGGGTTLPLTFLKASSKCLFVAWVVGAVIGQKSSCSSCNAVGVCRRHLLLEGLVGALLRSLPRSLAGVPVLACDLRFGLATSDVWCCHSMAPRSDSLAACVLLGEYLLLTDALPHGLWCHCGCFFFVTMTSSPVLAALRGIFLAGPAV
jgi:hypothetical protein